MSDCLSRLEDNEETDFDEEAIRDVSGAMFGGEPVPCHRTSARLPHSWLQPQLRRYVWIATEPLITSPLTPHLDGFGSEDIRLGDGSQPRSDEESSEGTRSCCW